MENRTIKFKVWDINKKCFIPNDVYGIITTDFKAFGIMTKDWQEYKEGEYFYPEYQIPCQYTGLHDKNGNEIYEGDILMYIASSMSDMSVEFKDGCFVGVGPFNTHPLINYINAIDFESIEVIGNVYQPHQ